MHGKNLILDDGRKGEVVEYFRAVSPDVDAPEFPQAFVVEAVYLRDLSAFVIASDEGDAIGIADF